MTPFNTAVSRNLHILFGSMPAVRDGDVDAIHDARVATRRVRALLPIALSGYHHSYLDRWLPLLRDAGRLIGRARDLDVALEQLDHMEARLPSAGAVIAAMRAELSAHHAKQRRRLVKGLDALSLAELQSLRRSGAPREVVRGRSARAAAEAAIAEQAESVRNAVVKASGIYMPNRAHVLRIEMKMLRYLLEPLSDDRPVRTAVKPLKRAQEVLGTLHDRQGLIDLIDSARRPESGRAAIRSLAEQDCRDLFRSYVEQRDAVVRACDHAEEAVKRPNRGARMVALTAMAVPSVLWLLRAERGRAPAADETVRTVRRTVHDERAAERAQLVAKPSSTNSGERDRKVGRVEQPR